MLLILIAICQENSAATGTSFVVDKFHRSEERPADLYRYTRHGRAAWINDGTHDSSGNISKKKLSADNHNGGKEQQSSAE